MEDAGNKGNLLVLFGTPVKYASLSFGIARGTADFTDPPASPVRLALPVRHRLRLRRLPGGHGRRAGLRESDGGQAPLSQVNCTGKALNCPAWIASDTGPDTLQTAALSVQKSLSLGFTRHSRAIFHQDTRNVQNAFRG